MWSFIILCIIYSASASEIFRMCCPNGQSLIKVIDLNATSNAEYKCLDDDLKRKLNINFPISSIFAGDHLTVEYGVPKDCDLEMTQVDENLITLSDDANYCYSRLVLEMINGTAKQIIPKTVGIVCNGSITSGTDVKTQNIRKCCPPGQMYDTRNHQCRTIDEDNEDTTNYDHQWFRKQLKTNGGEVFEFDVGLTCKSVEYDVQLKDAMFSLIMEGSTLNILSRTRDDHPVLSPAGNWCVDREYSSSRLMARVCTQNCSLFDAYCFRKCCPIGYHYQPLDCSTSRSQCVPSNNETVFDLSEYLDPINEEYGIGDVLGVRTDMSCPIGKIVMDKSMAHDAHSLTKDGLLHSKLGTDFDYCLELFARNTCTRPPFITAVLCYKPPEEPAKNFKLSFTLNSISCVCLALTLVVYILIPELRNLHGRNVMCHVSMMLFAFSCLARVQYKYVPDVKLCATLGYGIYFGFVAAFVWLNVMCFDIWFTFGSVRTVQPLNKGRATTRRFLWYSLYAWGLAITMTLVMFLLDKYPVHVLLDANMGQSNCWFGSIQNSSDDWPHYIFFVIPMGIVTSINFVLWLLTARHCAQVKSEVHRLQAGSVGDRAKKRFRVDKANFVLTGKLWVVMGAGWSTELISTLLDARVNIWLTSAVDIINELQGVFIFVILIFKPKLYYLIRKKLGLATPDTRKSGQSSTARTSSTFLSRAISSDERTNARISVPNDNAKQH